MWAARSNSAVHRMLQRAAAQAGGSLDYRVIVSNFDAAFRAVAAGLGVSVIPMQVGSVYTAFADVKLVPLSDGLGQPALRGLLPRPGIAAAGGAAHVGLSGGKGRRLTGRQAGIHRFPTIRRHFTDIYR